MISSKLILVDGEAKLILDRLDRGDGIAIVDWINFSIHESTIFNQFSGHSKTEFLSTLSRLLFSIFGIKLNEQLERGRNFYRESWALGDKGRFGFIGWGGQASTVGISLNGTGCSYSSPGWEKRLETFFNSADGAQISRIDLAHDDMQGEIYCIEGVIHAFHQGFFNNGGRVPRIELRGNHIRPDGRGRTVYIGSRENMLLRAYEKGKQLGDSESSWLRCEVEIHHGTRLIPFDVLTKPGQYFCGTYPIFATLSNKQSRMATRKKTENHDFDRMCDWLRHQCGTSLSLMVAVEGPEKTLAFLQRDFKEKAKKIFPSLALPQEETESLPATASTGIEG